MDGGPPATIGKCGGRHRGRQWTRQRWDGNNCPGRNQKLERGLTGGAKDDNHYTKQGKIPRLQPRNLFTKPMTICYICRLTEEYPDEYKGNKYNLIHSSVPTNINYIHRLRGTDEHNYLYSSVPHK
jgi:hypothetical protein